MKRIFQILSVALITAISISLVIGTVAEFLKISFPHGLVSATTGAITAAYTAKSRSDPVNFLTKRLDCELSIISTIEYADGFSR